MIKKSSLHCLSKGITILLSRLNYRYDMIGTKINNSTNIISCICKKISPTKEEKIENFCKKNAKKTKNILICFQIDFLKVLST